VNDVFSRISRRQGGRVGLDRAAADLLSLPIARFPTGPLMIRAYELRSNMTPYDATYVALAEGLS